MKRLVRFALVGIALLVALPACRAASAEPGERTVHITIHFSRFSPEQVQVLPGQTVRFVVRNTDPIDHEFILGDARVQLVHEKGTEPTHAPRPGEMSVPAGTTQLTTYTFPALPGSLEFACHLPGHHAYGMHGTVSFD